MRLRAAAALERADDAGLAESPVHLVAPTGEPLGHEIARPRLLIGELGMAMDIVPDGDYLRVKLRLADRPIHLSLRFPALPCRGGRLFAS